MIQAAHAFVIRTAVQAVTVSVVNGLRPADVATEIDNDFDWLLNGN